MIGRGYVSKITCMSCFVPFIFRIYETRNSRSYMALRTGHVGVCWETL